MIEKLVSVFLEGDLKLMGNLVIALAHMEVGCSVCSQVCYVTVGVGQ